MGIYSAVSYDVVLRTREVGIRMAIGAQKNNVLALMLRGSLRPVVFGLMFGTAVVRKNSRRDRFEAVLVMKATENGSGNDAMFV